MRVEVRFAQVGDVSEGIIGQWKKKPQDSVQQGEALVEIETGKAVVDCEAPASGVLSEVIAAQGSTVHVGDLIAIITAA